MRQSPSDKHGAQLVYQPVNPRDSTEKWKQNFSSSIPWSGFFGIIIAILSAIGSIIALYSANGKEVDSWPSKDRPIQLTVMLAILTAIGNVGLGIAFTDGATIAWWVKMSQGVTLGESHRYWEHSSSAWQSVLGLAHRRINKVTFVSILMALHFANGPLIQRATHSPPGLTTEKATFHAAFSPDQFNQSTGYYLTRAPVINMLADNFTRVVLAYTNRDPMRLDLKGCDGSCSGVLVGAGFDVGCVDQNQNFTVDDVQGGDMWTVGGVELNFDGTVAPEVLKVVSTYKSKPGPKGNLTITTCLLKSAVVRYPIRYANGTVTLGGFSSVADGTENRTEKLLHPEREHAGLGRWPSLLGGFHYALSNLFTSNITLYYTGVMAVQGNGPMGSLYRDSSDDALGTLNTTWSDPTPSILEAFHEMAFRTALDFSNSSFEQTI